MNHLRYLAIMAIIVVCIQATAQIDTSDTIYYAYELESTGEFNEVGDTLYDVSFIIEDKDLPKIKSLLILYGNNEQTIVVDESSIANDSRFEKKEKSLKVKIDKLTGPSDSNVIGLNDMGEQVLMIKHEDKHSVRVVDTVIIPKKPRNLPKKKKDKKSIAQ